VPIAEDDLLRAAARVAESADENIEPPVVIYVEESGSESRIRRPDQVGCLELSAAGVVKEHGAAGKRAGKQQVRKAVTIVVAKSRADEQVIVHETLQSIFFGAIHEAAVLVDEQRRVHERRARQSAYERKPQAPTRDKQIQLAVIVNVGPGRHPT